MFHRFSWLRSRHAAVILCALAMLLGVRFGDGAAEGRNEVSVPSVAASVSDPTLDPGSWRWSSEEPTGTPAWPTWRRCSLPAETLSVAS